MDRPARSFARRFANGALCLAAFCASGVGTATLLGRIAPLPEGIGFTMKLRVLAARKVPCEVLFTGSSRVNRQIDPAVFDAVAAEAGRPVHSFNLGQDGTVPPESFFLVRHLLRQPVPRPKWMFVELAQIAVALPDARGRTEKDSYWRDRHHTDVAECALFGMPLLSATKAAALWEHETLWLKRTCGYGIGAPLVTRVLWPSPPEGPPVWAQRAGFRPLRTDPLAGRERAEFLETLEKERAAIVKQNASIDAPLLRDLHELIAELRRAGVEPVFFIPPMLSPPTNYAAAPDGAVLLSFSRPDLYPELYRPENYHDKVHLTPAGAAIFSELLAQKFVELVPDRP